MALDTVQDYIDRARVLLLDQVEPYRYPDSDLVEALNTGIFEAVRVRPDLFFKLMRTGSVPQYSTASPLAAVAMDIRYRPSLLYYVVGMAQLRDDEDVQDARSAALLNKFIVQFTTIQS